MTGTLAVSFALAMVGLFCEVADRLQWSRRGKRWGGFASAGITMGVVLLLHNQLSHLGMAAAGVVLVLAVSVFRSQEVTVAPTSGVAEGQAGLMEDNERRERDEVVLAEEPVEAEELVATAEEAVEEEELVLAEEAVEEELVLAEEPVEAEELVATAVESVESDELVMAEELVAVEELEEPVSVEWLNMQIAHGFEAKAMGQVVEALRYFEEAFLLCKEAELSDMLRDEIAECRAALPPIGEISVRQAS